MPFDFKKEYKEFYLPPAKPGIVQVPAMSYVAVRGQGDPNDESGAYQAALNLLYGIAFTIKMSPKAGHAIEGFFEYVVPPLEGFWWQDGVSGVDYSRKEDFQWISCIRLPEFVTREEFDEAPVSLSLAGLFLETNVPYTFEQYQEHLRLTQEFAKTHEGCELRIVGSSAFHNTQIVVCEGSWVLVTKAKAPTIHFVIEHPRMVEAFENFVPLA